MPERRVSIPAGPHQLEAAFEKGLRSEGAVLCHPHPLYGGNMDNNVVMALRRSLATLGWSTLRFNFRGVGSSGGSYGDGGGETEDLLAAANYLSGEGLSRIHVAGYSFGAWIALRALRQRLAPATLILVSPPIDFLDFSSLMLPPTPKLITLGDQDSFCSLSTLESWLKNQADDPQPGRVEILKGCDHFYWGYESRLESIVEEFVNALTPELH